MNKLLTSFLLTVVLILPGCTTNGKIDLFKGVETAAHLKLLDAEFDQVVAILEAEPFNAEERAIIDYTIAEAEIEREFLRTLHKQGAGTIALEGARAQTRLDSITEIVKTGRQTYQSYLVRTDQDAPNPTLKAAYDSAVLSGDRIQEAIDSGQGVTGLELAEHMMIGLRLLAAIKGVPVPLS